MDATSTSHLLSLQIGSAEIDLPLIGPVGTELLSICSAGGADGQQLFASDPALALWVACQFPDSQTPADMAALSEFFDDRWFELAWSASVHRNAQHERQVVRVSEDNWRRWQAISERGVWVANRAKSLALDEGTGDCAEQAYLLGLLHLIPFWVAVHFKLSGQTDDVGEVAATDWPRWLQPAIGRQSSDPQSAQVWSLVARATADWNNKELRRAEWTDLCRQVRQRWSSGTVAPRLPVVALLSQLAECHQLRSDYEQRLEQEKLSSLKELAYGASHEINNPLANIATRAQALMPDESDPERRRKLATINSQAFRAHEMISDMMLFAKPPKLALKEADALQVVSEVSSELQTDASLQDTHLFVSCQADEIKAEFDTVHLGAALRAMCINSLEALGAGGEIEVGLSSSDALVTISVRDTGPGIPEHVRTHLFDPFYSGREAGRGLGFGLSKCWRIVTDHGGRVSVQSDEQGTTFLIELPRRGPHRQAS